MENVGDPPDVTSGVSIAVGSTSSSEGGAAGAATARGHRRQRFTLNAATSSRTPTISSVPLMIGTRRSTLCPSPRRLCGTAFSVFCGVMNSATNSAT